MAKRLPGVPIGPVVLGAVVDAELMRSRCNADAVHGREVQEAAVSP